MKRITSVIQRMRLPALAGLVVMSLAVGGSLGQAKSEPFSHLFVFGDSLSDTGNYYCLSGGSPPPPYAEGRFCNGLIWVEYLAASLEMEYQPADNFAVGGATTGTLNYNDGFAGKEYPGLCDEIATFQAMSPLSEPERALWVVEAGANDFFLALANGTSPATLIGNGVNNTVAAIQQLWSAGARFILVMNVPDLGVTPLAHSLGEGGPLMLTQLTAAYNQALDLALAHLAQAGIPTIRLDAFAVLDEMVNTPAAYGFTNITTPCLLAPPGTSPAQFLFWDPVHPTTGAHKVLAREALEQLLSTFSPSNGRGTTDARANALHGLVNASQHKLWPRN
jgi:phospholipase/lecithinase/hemolysin